MGFFFAWVGAPPIPAFTLTTVGDVWGGSQKYIGSTWNGELQTTGDIFTTGVLSEDGKTLSGLQDIDGLIEGNSYFISGSGISVATITTDANLSKTQTGGLETQFVFDGVDGGTLTPPASQVGENIAVTISTIDPSIDDFGFAPGSDKVRLEDPTGLVNGTVYNIAASGIPQNTTFTYEGGNEITISNPATTTASGIELTISLDVGRNIISNLGSHSGLEVDEVYQIFSRGVPASTLGTYQSNGTILLSQDATLTGTQTLIKIHRGIIYPDGGAFDESIHARNDETVLSVKIDHSESAFPLLTIELKNPRIGLLAPSRNVWCWLSWQKTTADPVVALFHGRLVAAPSDMQGEKVSLQFIAQPADYDNQRALLAETLKVVPYYDPVWLANGVSTPETILEARTASWHTDRVTLGVTISDMIVGEDGTLEVGEADAVYADTKVRFGSTPLTGIYLTASVTGSQEGSGVVDITRQITKAFQDAGSVYTDKGIISSFCGDGLFSSWPKPGASIGGGWKVGLSTEIVKATWLAMSSVNSTFTSNWDPYAVSGFVAPTGGVWDAWRTTFPLDAYAIRFFVEYDAKRSWTEVVSFFLEADIQEIITDSRATTESLSLSSALLNEPIDNGLMPIRDLRHNSYFKTARGEDSFKFLVAYTRAKLVFRSRAVAIDIVVPWDKAVNANLSCRWNVHLTDPRLPGGEATGKVTAYQLIASAAEGQRAKITLECAIGRGGSVAASEGVGNYASSGYMASGYQTMTGGTVDLGDNSVTFQSFSDFEVADDGLNLFDMSPDNIIRELKVVGGVTAQMAAISATKTPQVGVNIGVDASVLTGDLQTGKSVSVTGASSSSSKLPDALKQCYAKVSLKLNPVTGGGFLSEFAIDVSKLQIPKTIDLEAPSNA